ncbi:MAG: YidH family protein [Gammaproteobacteria bacterium]
MQSDPRVFFASERTLLAWVRTGIAVAGLGFVVSRFGLLLRVLAMQLGAGHGIPKGHGASNLIGISLVLLGAASVAGASLQHGRFIATLPERDQPTRYSRTFALWLSTAVAAASVLLAVFLWFSA